MKIVLAGGGSGGHVTPLKAISEQLLIQNSHAQLIIITDRGFYGRTKQIFSQTSQTKVKKIFAGKIRRYHGKSVFWHITHLPTIFKNIRDVFYLLVGGLQSIWLLATIKPDVVFCKGGFVCVPIGYAAKLLKIKLIIHDSDTKPGLTNRLLSKFSDAIATGMPLKFYPYDKSITTYIGMPVNASYKPVTKSQQDIIKKDLGFEPGQPILLLTGGGNGSVNLNKILSDGAGELLSSGWGIIHLVGKGKAEEVLKVKETLAKDMQQDWQVEEFTDMVPRLLAADIVVCRTSASTLQECANAKKTVIGVASPNLSDQIMNAEYFSSKNSIISLKEQGLFSGQVSLAKVVKDTNIKDTKLAENLHKIFAKPGAAKELARIILNS